MTVFLQFESKIWAHHLVEFMAFKADVCAHFFVEFLTLN